MIRRQSNPIHDDSHALARCQLAHELQRQLAVARALTPVQPAANFNRSEQCHRAQLDQSSAYGIGGHAAKQPLGAAHGKVGNGEAPWGASAPLASSEPASPTPMARSPIDPAIVSRKAVTTMASRPRP